VVIDLRGNSGGDSEIIKPLIQALKKHPSLSDKGHLYVLIGGHTFSSGADGALYLRNHLNAILVGKPTGGKPNSYGEIKGIKLPNSQLVVFYPVKWFKLVPDGDPPSVEPDIVVGTSLNDILDGRDPMLEAALAPGLGVAARGAAAIIRK
jgi:C-terminal processing protease CtpA/Prc